MLLSFQIVTIVSQLLQDFPLTLLSYQCCYWIDLSNWHNQYDAANVMFFLAQQHLELTIEEIPASRRIGSVICLTDTLKASLVAEARAWKVAFGRALNGKASADMEEIFTFIEDMQKRLARPIKDLDDVRAAMAALEEIRANEIKIDMTITPVEESFMLLNKFELHFHDGNAEKVDSLSYSWKNLHAQVMPLKQDWLQSVVPNLLYFQYH